MIEPDLTVRPADLERDLDDLMALFAQGDRCHAQRIPYVFRETELSAADLVQRISHEPNHHLLCAEVGGHLVGTVHFCARESPTHDMFVPRRFIMVQILVVLESCRRQGVGRALMRAVEETAHEFGISDIRLNVWEANTDALRFYESLGYETLSRYMIKRT